jgi:hypothetical protein
MVLMSIVEWLRFLPMGVVSKNQAGTLVSLWSSLSLQTLIWVRQKSPESTWSTASIQQPIVLPRGLVVSENMIAFNLDGVISIKITRFIDILPAVFGSLFCWDSQHWTICQLACLQPWSSCESK